MGLKQDVARALGTPVSENQIPEKPAPPPVEVSPTAVRALSQKVREWSGWPNATLRFGQPEVSPHAECDHVTRSFTVNPETLVLNPNRVLLTVTPFRLRQEAVLTGALLHEAGHARHSHWLPRTEAQAKVKPARHSDGTEPTGATIALARLMEEPRIEGLQARDADKIGATGLDWTMRASAAHLIPTTVLSTTVPEQMIMDLITSWALRAGRQIALNHYTGRPMRNWVQDFTTLLHTEIVKHLTRLDTDDPSHETKVIMENLFAMLRCTDDDGSTMIDHARAALTLLFPETDDDDMPEPSGGCEGGAESDESGGESGQAAQGESDTDPSEEGAEEGATADESDEQGSGGGEGQPEDTEPGDGSGEDESTESEDEGESESEGEDEDEVSDGSDTEQEAEAESEGEPAASEEFAAELADLEDAAKGDVEQESEDEASKTPPMESGGTAGGAGQGTGVAGFRQPTKEEREFQKGAERFLRDLISPTEASAASLSESPSATVDAAALAAWKADGGTREPRFFMRTRREVEPSPPVKIAILVDVSSSMEQLQKPSALLSWALASAALDLRNFAGRGQQIESTLIHWGNEARVIQKNGQPLPGIREVPCSEGTSAMEQALDLVAEEIPGFFDLTDRPVHRLLVQFTDWELFGRIGAAKRIAEALAAGVNMVTVAPGGLGRSSSLDAILRRCTVQRGTSTVVNYSKAHPEKVWDESAKALR